jgi:hypothetical protein
MLCCLSKYGSVVGGPSSMVTDSGIGTWALTASGGDLEDYYGDRKEDPNQSELSVRRIV